MMQNSESEPCPRLPLWVRLAFLYLFAPLFLFLAGWTHYALAIPLMLWVAWTLVDIVKAEKSPKGSGSDVDGRTAFWIIGVALAFSLATGLSDLLPQSSDYLKHNLVLADLVEFKWPVRYADGNESHYLCYGIGYYLVPSVLGKMTGASWVPWFSFVWGALGVILLCFAIASHFPKKPLAGLIIVLPASGIGVAWLLSKSGIIPLPGIEGSADGAISGLLMSLGLYTSNLDTFTRILYQPQHGIAGLLASLAAYHLVIQQKRHAEACSLLAAMLLWSPLSTLPGGCLIGVSLVCKRFPALNRHLIIHSTTAVLLTLLFAAYYLPHLPIREKGLIWNLNEGHGWMGWYAWFNCCFVLLPASAVFWSERKSPFLGELKPVVIAMVLLLLVLPLFKYGFFSDLRMQVSGPSFVFIGIALGKSLLSSMMWRLSATHVWLWGIYLSGATFPILRTADHLLSGAENRHSIPELRKQGIRSVRDFRMAGFDAASQYLGESSSPAVRWILRPP